MIRTPDGVPLRSVRWPPPPGRKGTVCLFQGRTECIEKYFEMVRELRARGFAVATLDWRGQGLSDRALRDRARDTSRTSPNTTPTLRPSCSEIVLPDCPPPHFALGHSMGATVLLRAAHRGKRWFDRIVLTSPMIGSQNGAMLGSRDRWHGRFTCLALGPSYVPGGGPAMQHCSRSPVTSSHPIRFATPARRRSSKPIATSVWAADHCLGGRGTARDG